MTDRQALLAAIRAHPDEDTPRLAFADWLDEQGDPFFAHWATLIRVQIDAAAQERFSPRWLELAAEQKRLFAARPKEWTLAWESRLGAMAYRRGFREAAALDPDTFPVSFDRVFGSNPIRAVSMNLARAARKAPIAEYPGLAYVETLDLFENGTVTAPRFLRRAAEGMPRLRALGLARMELSTSQVDDVLAIPGLQRLEALDLSGNPLFRSVTHGRPETLFRGPAMERARWLDLADTCPSAEALHSLARSPRLKNLKFLNLSRAAPSNPEMPTFGSAGTYLLTLGHALRGVEHLDLSGQEIGTSGVRHLLDAGLLENVRELILVNNGIDDDGAVALADSPQLARLRRLELGRNPVTDAGRLALLGSPHLTNMTVLDGATTTEEARAALPRVGGDPFVSDSHALFAPCP